MRLIAISDDFKTNAFTANQTKLSVQLNTAFVLYNLIARQELSTANPVDVATHKALNDIGDKLKIHWMNEFTPIVGAAYKAGSGALSEEVAATAAGKYSGMLFSQINGVSDKAFIEGYNAALNKGWPKALAWQRVAEAYGLDPVQMRSWITYYPTEGYQPDVISDKALKHRDKLFAQRAERIAEHESRTVLNLGKQFGWTEKIRNNQLPKDAKKVFMTAQDERVCPECGPLDGKVIPIDERFNGILVPPLHVNCRCEIAIIHDNAVVKSFGGDEYTRDSSGRFASVESRSFNPRSNSKASYVPTKVKTKPSSKKRNRIKDIPYEIPEVFTSELLEDAEVDTRRKKDIAESKLSTAEYLKEEAVEREIHNAVNNKETVLAPELAEEVKTVFKDDNDAQRIANILDAESIKSSDKKFLQEQINIKEEPNLNTQQNIRERVKESIKSSESSKPFKLDKDIFLSASEIDAWSDGAEHYVFKEDEFALDPQQSYGFLSAIREAAADTMSSDKLYTRDEYDEFVVPIDSDIASTGTVGTGRAYDSELDYNDEEDYESYNPKEDALSSDIEYGSSADVYIIPKGTELIWNGAGYTLPGGFTSTEIDEVSAEQWGDSIPDTVSSVRLHTLTSDDSDVVIKPDAAEYSSWNDVDDTDSLIAGDNLVWRNNE